MSTLKVANIQSTTTGAPTFKNISGTEIGQLCRAWVNFNGTGTVAIRDSYNVSSITDNDAGDYTVNFTNQMSSTDYVPVVTNIVRSNQASGTSSPGLRSESNSTSPNASITTSGVRIIHRPTSANADADMLGVAIFGN